MNLSATPQQIAVLAIGIFITLGVFALCHYLFRRILRGEGDDSIAGYNTMNDEKKAQYDIVRLRKACAYSGYTILGWCLAICLIVAIWRSKTLLFVLLGLSLVLVAGMVWFMDRWSKKK